ncbi:MAG: hypothetical protein ACI9FB_001546 [Candidatus Azotimanducaceae bacterium]|jgi:hypothetical protein
MVEGDLSENLHIQCRPSRLHLIIIAMVHGAVLFTLALLSKYFVVYQIAVYLLAIIVCLSAIYFCRKALHLYSNCIVEVEARKLENKIVWKIGFKNGDVKMVSLKDNFLVWPHLVICQFFDNKNAYSLVLLRDSLSPQAHRHTRVYLSLYGVNRT